MSAHARTRTPRSRRTVLTVAAAAGAVTLASTGIALAAISTTGPYTGCVSNSTGALRVIDVANGDTCIASGRKAETQISWSQTGPKGDKGDPGDKGDKGDPGSPGTFNTATLTTVQGTLVSTSDLQGAQVSCPSGSTATGGGFSVVSGLAYYFVVQVSHPMFDSVTGRPTGWTVTASSADSTSPIGYKAYVICAS